MKTKLELEFNLCYLFFYGWLGSSSCALKLIAIAQTNLIRSSFGFHKINGIESWKLIWYSKWDMGKLDVNKIFG